MESATTIPEVTVYFPGALREKVRNQRTVLARGRTIREVIDQLEQDFPGMRFSLCYETGEVRVFVNIFVERQHIRYLQGLDTPLSPGANIHIFQSVAGG